MDFCWTCGSYGKGQYHQPGSLCTPSQWHIRLLPRSHTGFADNLIKPFGLGRVAQYEMEVRNARDRIKTFQDAHGASMRGEGRFSSEALGYVCGLTIATIDKAEGAQLDAARILMHTHLMLYRSEQNRFPEGPKHLQILQAITPLDSLLYDLQRLVRPLNLGQPAQPPGSNSRNLPLNRQVQSKSHNLVPLIRQLRDSLAAWNKASQVES